MLLDEKKTKRNVKIVSVIAALAFAGGLIPIMIYVIFFGGGQEDGTGQILKEAIAKTQSEPKNPDGWDDLAAYYRDQANNRTGDLPKATDAAKKALALTPEASPDKIARNETLVQILQTAGNGKQALNVANAFTNKHPNNPEGFFLLGSVARDEGNVPLARLSFERYLKLAPNGDLAEDVRAAVTNLNTQTTPATPATPDAPATPATP